MESNLYAWFLKQQEKSVRRLAPYLQRKLKKIFREEHPGKENAFPASDGGFKKRN